jgi:hypothetical protein
VLELKETAIAFVSCALDESQWTYGDRGIFLPWEDSGQRLLSKIKHRFQIGVVADPASRNLPEGHCHLLTLEFPD